SPPLRGSTPARRLVEHQPTLSRSTALETSKQAKKRWNGQRFSLERFACVLSNLVSRVRHPVGRFCGGNGRIRNSGRTAAWVLAELGRAASGEPGAPTTPVAQRRRDS